MPKSCPGINIQIRFCTPSHDIPRNVTNVSRPDALCRRCSAELYEEYARFVEVNMRCRRSLVEKFIASALQKRTHLCIPGYFTENCENACNLSVRGSESARNLAETSVLFAQGKSTTRPWVLYVQLLDSHDSKSRIDHEIVNKIDVR